jgi:uncharacterized membrane protein YeiH
MSLEINLISILNIFGIIAFAVSGALKGMKHQLDILGVIVLGIITALGGGILRDVMMVTLPSSLVNERDIYFAIIASLITYFAGKRIHNLAAIIKIFDAAGLAVFTIIGAEKGYSGGLGVLGVIIMGTVTGVAGGVVRDICVAEIPFILREEVYAVFCIAGAFIFWLLSSFGLPHHFTVWPVILFIFAGRIIALYFNLHLPRRKI